MGMRALGNTARSGGWGWVLMGKKKAGRGAQQRGVNLTLGFMGAGALGGEAIGPQAKAGRWRGGCHPGQ